MNERFFETDRKMNNLELGQDGFFDFDTYPEIDQNFGKKSFNFQTSRQKLKMGFDNNKHYLLIWKFLITYNKVKIWVDLEITR